MHGWAPPAGAWGPGPSERIRHHTGPRSLDLSDAHGEQMRCRFRLADPPSACPGGGSGRVRGRWRRNNRRNFPAGAARAGPRVNNRFDTGAHVNLESEMKIGIAGTGRMGTAIALRLQEVGHEITVWNRTPEKTAVAAGAGAVVAPTPGSISCRPATGSSPF